MLNKTVLAIALCSFAMFEEAFAQKSLQTDLVKDNVRQGKYITLKAEDKWWNDFETSGQKDMVKYVHNLSSSNPEAASWFLLTGGKNGFSSRKASGEEEKMLLAAMSKIAHTIVVSNKNAYEWSERSTDGQYNFKMIFNLKNEMEQFRGYYEGLKDTLKDKIQDTKVCLDKLLEYETSNNDKVLRAVLDCAKTIAEIRKVDFFVFYPKKKKPLDDELSKAYGEYNVKKTQITSEWHKEKSRLTSEWHKIHSDPKSSKKQKDKAYQYLKESEKELWERTEKADKEAKETYSKLSKKVQDKLDQDKLDIKSNLIDQYGSVRKANQENLKAKFAEWQTKRKNLESLGIETPFEIIETVNNAFSGLLTTAAMRDGLIETLEKRAITLEHEKRGKEIWNKKILKGMQIKLRLINKNLGWGHSEALCDQLMAQVASEGIRFELAFKTIIENRY